MLDTDPGNVTVLRLNLLDLLEGLNLEDDFTEAAIHSHDHDSASESICQSGRFLTLFSLIPLKTPERFCNARLARSKATESPFGTPALKMAW